MSLLQANAPYGHIENAQGDIAPVGSGATPRRGVREGITMARRGPKDSQRTRAESERARLYAARTQWHKGQISRRVRDNTIAGVVGGLVVVGAIASQSVHAAVTAPGPEPTQTSTPAPPENPFADLFVGGTPAE